MSFNPLWSSSGGGGGRGRVSLQHTYTCVILFSSPHSSDDVDLHLIRPLVHRDWTGHWEQRVLLGIRLLATVELLESSKIEVNRAQQASRQYNPRLPQESDSRSERGHRDQVVRASWSSAHNIIIMSRAFTPPDTMSKEDIRTVADVSSAIVDSISIVRSHRATHPEGEENSLDQRHDRSGSRGIDWDR